MKTRHILQILSISFLVALYSSVIYILGNGLFKDFLVNELPNGQVLDNNTIMVFVVLLALTLLIGFTLFTPQKENPMETFLDKPTSKNIVIITIALSLFMVITPVYLLSGVNKTQTALKKVQIRAALRGDKTVIMRLFNNLDKPLKSVEIRCNFFDAKGKRLNSDNHRFTQDFTSKSASNLLWKEAKYTADARSLRCRAVALNP